MSHNVVSLAGWKEKKKKREEMLREAGRRVKEHREKRFGPLPYESEEDLAARREVFRNYEF